MTRVPDRAEPDAARGADDQAGDLLVVDGLAVVRGQRTVLDIDHLRIAARETLAVVGPNGAGKSTLLLAIGSLIRPTSGEVRFRGTTITPRNELAYRRRIGLVFPDPLLLDASVMTNVGAGLRFRGVAGPEIRRRSAEWLERLGVAHLADRRGRQISSGEAQRVSLARALVLEPDLLLLDEPFASVDAASRARLLDDLGVLLAETQVTCIFVTHDLDEAARMGHRMAVVIDGRLRQWDTPERVMALPVDEEVAAFVGTETRIPGRVVSSEDGITTVDIGHGLVEAAASVGPGRDVLCCLRPEDVTIWTTAGPDAPRAAGAERRVVSSARNQLRGTVIRVVLQGALARVTIDCGVPMVATITRTSAAGMGLEAGTPVQVAFKATAVHLIPRAT